MMIKSSQENLRRREVKNESESKDYFPDELRFKQAMEIKVGYSRNRKFHDPLETGYD